jgi:hypothetical protein
MDPIESAHWQMWLHYDKLRQDKSKTFLAVHSIAAGAIAVVWKEGRSATLPIALLSALGLIVCALWALLLSRNSAYVTYHRQWVKTFESWDIESKRLPWYARVSSGTIDRALPLAFAAYYLVAFSCRVLAQ